MPSRSGSPSRVAFAGHRLLLRARGARTRRLLGRAQLAAARACGRYLVRGEPDATVYVRGGVEIVPGLSDVDLAIVVGDEAAASRVRGRWRRLARTFASWLVDWPFVYSEAELRTLVGSSTYTFAESGYVRGDATLDAIRTLERPGLHATTSDWRPLLGRDRRRAEPERDAEDRRIAAWLELVTWWRLAFLVCAGPTLPRAADLGVKLVSEPARIWLWLAHGERVATRAEALRRAAIRLPEEEEPLWRALDLQRALGDRPEPQSAALLPLSVRLSARIARVIAAEIEPFGSTGVRLSGSSEGTLPLGDWRAIVCPEPLGDSFELAPGRPGDPSALAAALRESGAYAALRDEDLLVMPSLDLPRSRLRGIQCRVVDPGPFALLDGARVAAFPEVRGWSALDTARRAVAEHRAWLRTGADSPGILLSAARAALFLDSVESGEPELCLTAAETAGRLGVEPADLRRRVLGLPAYEGRDPLQH